MERSGGGTRAKSGGRMTSRSSSLSPTTTARAAPDEWRGTLRPARPRRSALRSRLRGSWHCSNRAAAGKRAPTRARSGASSGRQLLLRVRLGARSKRRLLLHAGAPDDVCNLRLLTFDHAGEFRRRGRARELPDRLEASDDDGVAGNRADVGSKDGPAAHAICGSRRNPGSPRRPARDSPPRARSGLPAR